MIAQIYIGWYRHRCESDYNKLIDELLIKGAVKDPSTVWIKLTWKIYISRLELKEVCEV